MTGFAIRPASFVRRFRKDEAGNATIVCVYLSLAILLTTGAAIDVMRYEAIRTKMQHVLDRAVLAAADLDQQADPSGVALDYVSTAGVSGALTSVVVDDGLNYRTVSATGTTSVQTLFMRMAGIDTLSAPAASTAEEKIANVEISLVLGISGSMRLNNRLENLKPAAKAFVDKVMTSETNGVTTLNLVPYAGQVNPGKEMFDYFNGRRPKVWENNGWGNGDQDAPGNSLCNNNAENAEAGAADPSCAEGLPEDSAGGRFSPWPQAISNVVYYFDLDNDDQYDVAHKIESFPESAPRDADDFFKGHVAYLMNAHAELSDPNMFLGASIKGGNEKNKYFQVKGDQNGPASDLGPTKNQGKIPGETYNYGSINHARWEASYVAPKGNTNTNSDTNTKSPNQKVNMTSSCVEIYDAEFDNTSLPTSSDNVPHFMFWPIEETVMDWGWCPEDDTAVRYYSNDAAELKTFIDNLRMHDGTAPQYGMKYALALLDPATRDAVSFMIDEGHVDPKFEGRPIAWENTETEKFIVLMSDGMVTDQFRPTDPKASENGEVELQIQGAASYVNFSDQATNVSNLHKQCDLAKSKGVVVFTIAYETNDEAAADMQHCASSASHFFRTNGAEISDVFDMVARQINNLRLIQ
ncbi:TadE/TadG family type IV pilus assembly protein [Marinovum sp.]|uniref:TadE/TadG family type IV pilus assembly protein n=1 Tax=Marinovum sp. TaxID=2024839 RepID=UPI002B276AB7|nr:TadE/TadG family type IV pilus assembly protein [Marinovum sp.]